VKFYDTIPNLLTYDFHQWLLSNSYEANMYALQKEFHNRMKLALKNNDLDDFHRYKFESLLNQVKDKLDPHKIDYQIDNSRVLIRYFYNGILKQDIFEYNDYELNKPLRPQVQALADCLYMVYRLEKQKIE